MNLTFPQELFISIVTAFLTAVATGVFAYFGFWRQAKAELQKEFGSRFNEKKWDIYLRFLKVSKNRAEIFAEIFADKMYEKTKPYYASFNPIREIESDLLLIGSKKFISSYSKWKDYLLSTSVDADTETDLYFHVIQAMREDLGEGKYQIDKQEFRSFTL